MNGNREIEVSERWGCGCIGTFDSGLTWAQSGTKYKRSKISLAVTSIALSLDRLSLDQSVK